MASYLRASWSNPRQRLGYIDLFCALSAALLWMWGMGQLAIWPLALALIPAGARLRHQRPPWHRSPLDLPLALFLATAFVGVWVAYDRFAAWDKWWLIVAAVLIYLALARQPRQNLLPIILALGFLGTAAAVYFLLSHDWQAYPVKFPVIAAVGVRWANIRPPLGLPALNPNVMAGIVALLSPYLVATAEWARQQDEPYLFGAAGMALAVNSLVILLAGSRGALLALLVVSCFWLLWQTGKKIWHSDPQWLRTVGPLLILGLIFLILLAGTAGGLVGLLNLLPGPESATHRLTLAQETLLLIADFPFTGGGLDAFPGLYSRYILGIPFYMLPNGHNIFLDVALEQGLPGLFALLLIIGTTLWLLISPALSRQRDGQMGRIRWAAGTSFFILLIHGLVEDTVYGSLALPSLFVAPGLAVASHLGRPQFRLFRGWPLLLLALVLLQLAVTPVIRAKWHANLGAVAMARIELRGWPTGEWSDGSHAPRLAPAEAHFWHTLQLHADNATAHYRLGLGAMARRDYESAVFFLEQAEAVGGEHPGINKALAYNYLWSGRVSEGISRLLLVPGAREEIGVYAVWWKRQGRDDLSAIAREAAQSLE